MSDTDNILAKAEERKQAYQLTYAGAVLPTEAYQLLQADTNTKIVDVRTHAELDWIGRVAIPDSQHIHIEWNFYPNGARNPDFIDELAKHASKDNRLLFLCRSGGRSHHAAMLAIQHGFAQSYNVLEGFEGHKDQHGHRKTVSGWCRDNLPWIGA